MSIAWPMRVQYWGFRLACFTLMVMATSKLDRLRAQLSNVRKDKKEQIQKATTLGLVLGGSFVAGYVPAKFPATATIGGIRTELLMGGVLVTAGLMDWLDDYSDEAVALGAGFLAADMARRGRELA
jgi:hypothetical protein